MYINRYLLLLPAIKYCKYYIMRKTVLDRSELKYGGKYIYLCLFKKYDIMIIS